MSTEAPKVAADLDETFTDGQKEASEYWDHYAQKFAKEVGTGLRETQEGIDWGIGKILSSPGMFGWEVEYNGQSILGAPAETSYVLINQTGASLYLDRLRQEKSRILRLPEPGQATDDLINGLHRHSQEKTGVYFKDDAEYAIRKLLDICGFDKFGIVTNSSGGDVSAKKSPRGKLSLLLGEDIANQMTIVEKARKNFIDPAYTMIREYVDVPEFPGRASRVYLRRRMYDDALLFGNGHYPQVAFGDIYHLDLALPEQRGVHTILVASQITPHYYREHYMNHRNGQLAQSLSRIPEMVKQFKS